jgi:ABC-type glycerol-3-phosphate transport system substrate-binding protein
MHIRPFEIGLIAFFGIAAISALIIFSNWEPEDPGKVIYGESVTIWGTLNADVMNEFITTLRKTDKALEVVSYRQIDERMFEDEIVNAIAEGRSPDLIVMPHSSLVSLRPKLQSISYETLTERTLRDTYIDGAEIFFRSNGVYGIPFAVDPLVLYWNRDIFSSSGLAQPPKTWESLVTQTQAIVRTDDTHEISQSAVAFGEYVNVRHAKEVLAMLLLQAGSSIVDESNGSYTVTLNKKIQNGLAPGEAVLTYYTQFAIPTTAQYSWNRSKSEDRREFLNGTLGMYFGSASERRALERENANLNFDMTEVPQGSGATILRNYGEFYAFAIPRGAKNASGAYAVATLFGTSANAQMLVTAYDFAPVHRVLHGKASGDPYINTVYQSGLIARGWLDPDAKKSGPVFQTMIEEITSGRARLNEAIYDGIYQLEKLF